MSTFELVHIAWRLFTAGACVVCAVVSMDTMPRLSVVFSLLGVGWCGLALLEASH